MPLVTLLPARRLTLATQLELSPPVIAPPQPNVPPIVLFPAKVIAVIPAAVVPVPAQQYGEPGWVELIETKTHKVRPLKFEDLVNEDKDSDGHSDWTNGEPDKWNRMVSATTNTQATTRR